MLDSQRVIFFWYNLIREWWYFAWILGKTGLFLLHGMAMLNNQRVLKDNTLHPSLSNIIIWENIKSVLNKYCTNEYQAWHLETGDSIPAVEHEPGSPVNVSRATLCFQRSGACAGWAPMKKLMLPWLCPKLVDWESIALYKGVASRVWQKQTIWDLKKADLRWFQYIYLNKVLPPSIDNWNLRTSVQRALSCK